MQVVLKIIIAIAICQIVQLNACCEKKLKKIARQIDRGRCGDLSKAQSRAMGLLLQCQEPQRATIENAFAILSRSHRFYPSWITNVQAVSSGRAIFDDCPGFRAKFVSYLCNLNQQNKADAFMRELLFSLSIEMRDDGERIVDFDQRCAIGAFESTFSLRTNRRWIYWQHEKIWASAERKQSFKVDQLKKLFLAQKIFVDWYNRLNETNITYYLLSSSPILPSWKRWFEKQQIHARYVEDPIGMNANA